MSVFNKSLDNQETDPFQQKLIKIFIDVKKFILRKEDKEKSAIFLSTLSRLETCRIAFFVAMAVWFVIAVIITILGIRFQLEIDLLEKVVTWMLWLAIFCEIVALVIFILEKTIRNKPKTTKNIKEIEEHILNSYTNKLKTMADIADKRIILISTRSRSQPGQYL